LGITYHYVLVNTFLYSVYGSVKTATRRNPALVGYRNQWIDALMASGNVEAIVTLGDAAAEAGQLWKTTQSGQASNVGLVAITHPTQPESSSKGDKTKLALATKEMLANWNVGLQALAPVIKDRDIVTPLRRYGDTWADGDRAAMPDADFPAGLPAWMRENDGWATRTGEDELAKRRNITIDVPKGIVS